MLQQFRSGSALCSATKVRPPGLQWRTGGRVRPGNAPARVASGVRKREAAAYMRMAMATVCTLRGETRDRYAGLFGVFWSNSIFAPAPANRCRQARSGQEGVPTSLLLPRNEPGLRILTSHPLNEQAVEWEPERENAGPSTSLRATPYEQAFRLNQISKLAALTRKSELASLR